MASRSVDMKTLVQMADGEDFRKPVVVYELADGDHADEYPDGRIIVRLNSRRKTVPRV